MHDKTYAEDDLTLPSGMYVFRITDQPVTNERLVSELATMFEMECKNPSVPVYNMAPYNNLHSIFTGNNAADRQMTFNEVHDFLKKHVPGVATLITYLSGEIQKLLNITQEELEHLSNLGIISYASNAGIQSHIDNVVRSGGTAGPVFLMRLYSCIGCIANYS